MKYKVGDLLMMKHFHHKPYGHLIDTLGIVTKVNCYAYIFYDDKQEQQEDKFAWFSQVDGKEYYFYEFEIEGEVIKL